MQQNRPAEASIDTIGLSVLLDHIAYSKKPFDGQSLEGVGKQPSDRGLRPTFRRNGNVSWHEKSPFGAYSSAYLIGFICIKYCADWF